MALSAKCLQFLFVSFSGIFFISAFAVIVLNSMFLYKAMRYNQFLDAYILLPCILMVVTGFLSLFFAWVGWKSAWSLHRVHIVMFGICLLLVVICEFGFCIWSLVIRDNMELHINAAMEEDFKAMVNKTEFDEVSVQKWDKIHREFQCCGVGGPGDYRTYKRMPWSCCISTTQPLDDSPSNPGVCGTVYQRGCIEPFHEYTRDIMMHVSLTAMGTAIVQAVGLLCTYYLQAAVGVRPSSPVVDFQRTHSTRRQAPQPPKGSASATLLSQGSSDERY